MRGWVFGIFQRALGRPLVRLEGIRSYEKETKEGKKRRTKDILLLRLDTRRTLVVCLVKDHPEYRHLELLEHINALLHIR